MLTATLTRWPANRATLLRNTLCPYCGCDLTAAAQTKEHVIGRRFAPKGKLNRHWNLIVNACEACNNRKADLENDIPAITLHPDLGGPNPDYDTDTITDAQRKAQHAISRRTGRHVKDSHEKSELVPPLGPGSSIKFNFTSPPQMDEQRAFELARLQLAGFFYFLTYQKDEERGYWWTGGFHPLLIIRRGDFGNKIADDFADAVLDWEPRLIAQTAEGFYRVCIRRHPHAECWSWAMEWNRSTRLLGFFGDRDAATTVVNTLGPLHVHHQNLGNGDYMRFRTEVPLDPENDRLFDWDS